MQPISVLDPVRHAARAVTDYYWAKGTHDAQAAALIADLWQALQSRNGDGPTDLRLLIADLIDPNDCNVARGGGVCYEHNNWDPAEHDGRECPHARARQECQWV